MKVFPKVKTLNIFDLDGTVINSFHRVKPCLKENGDLDLNKYRDEACQHDKIQADSLLPLSEFMKKSIKDNDIHNIILTARKMSKSDYYFLRKQGLLTNQPQAARVLSRDTLHKWASVQELNNVYYSSDSNYKSFYFQLIKTMYPNAVITVFDDHLGVLDAAQNLGITAINATVLNDILDTGYRLAGEQFIERVEQDITQDVTEIIKMLHQAWDNLSDEERTVLSCNVPCNP